MNVFVVKSVAPNVALGKIFVGVIPFIIAIFVGLVLVFVFPQIAVFLPGLLR